MSSAPTDSTAANRAILRRRRGKSKAPNFAHRGPVSVIPLELDASDQRVCQRLERHWRAVFRLRRALQRDAAARCRAYWAAHRERAADPKALRARLGLTRKGIEAAAKAHIDASGWMRDHLTKAVGLHVADEVWETIDRHLFADTSGRRHGAPRVGSWWDFTRMPGRARSHTKTTPVWETWRLVANPRRGRAGRPLLLGMFAALGIAACFPTQEVRTRPGDGSQGTWFARLTWRCLGVRLGAAIDCWSKGPQ